MDAFLAALLTFRTQLVALGANLYNNAVDAYNSAVAADASATVSTTQATAAVSGVNAIAWVSGTTYAVGNVRYSPADFRTYRRITAGAGVTDPSADATNWLQIAPGATATSAEIKAGATSAKSITPAAALSAFGFSAYAQTADQTITTGGALTIAHGLARAPVVVLGFLKCTTAELGYSIGDIVSISVGICGGGGENRGVAVVGDATNLSVRYGSTAPVFVVVDKSGGGSSIITAASWKFFVRAFA